jgi:integrase
MSWNHSVSVALLTSTHASVTSPAVYSLASRFRHSFATAALEAGVPLETVSTRVEHASIAITGDIYSHVREKVDRAAAEAVAWLILGRQTA